MEEVLDECECIRASSPRQRDDVTQHYLFRTSPLLATSLPPHLFSLSSLALSLNRASSFFSRCAHISRTNWFPASEMGCPAAFWVSSLGFMNTGVNRQDLVSSNNLWHPKTPLRSQQPDTKRSSADRCHHNHLSTQPTPKYLEVPDCRPRSSPAAHRK